MLAIIAIAAATAAPWQVDGTSLAVHYGQKPVQTTVDCPPPAPDAALLRGEPLTTLGVAVVAYSKKQGTMTWGHGSLRALFCEGDELHDVEYEVYRLSAWNEALLREEHEGEPFAEGPWLTSQRGAKVLFRNRWTVDGGWFATNQSSNREIYELWLGWPPESLDAVVIRAESAWEAQRERLRAEEALPERYDPIANNCTAVYYDFLGDDVVPGAPITPFAWVRKLEGDAVLRVLHPSHHLVNQWRGHLPVEVDKPAPLIRGPRTIKPAHRLALQASLARATPILPVATEPVL